MSTADKLNKILETKEAIKQAIRDKGVEIGDWDVFAEYPNAIRQIETGGSGGSDEFYNLRTNNGTNMSYLFYFYLVSELDLSGWDTSNVNDMTGMFNNCYSLITLNINNFNTSNVTIMNQMFNGCSALTALNVSSFNTSNVTDMYGMFAGCNALTSLDLNNFNTNNVINMNTMFYGCNTLIVLNLSNFNTSNVEDMGYMFGYCSSLTELDLSNFDTSNVYTIDGILEGCNNLHTLRLDNCDNDTIRKIIESSGFPTGFAWDDTLGEERIRKMYVNPDNIGELTAPEGWEFVYVEGNGSNEDNGGNEPETPEITLTPYVVGEFQNNTEITVVNTLVTSEHTDLSSMFFSCSNLTTINGIDQWDTSNVTTMNSMFVLCGLTELDLSSLDTGNVQDMNSMFKRSNIRTLDISNFDMTNVTDTSDMFADSTVCILRLDNCSYDTINKIITSENFPDYSLYNPETGENDITRQMYVQEANVSGLTAPNSWEFVYVN